MIAPAMIDSIRELLAAGQLSQRKIARRLGVSRGTVAGVAAGRRPDYEAIRRKREESRQPIPLGPLGRCATCGGLVYQPCRLCELRRQLAKLPRRAVDRRPIEPMGVELRGDAKTRYEAVHLARMQQGELDELGVAETLLPPETLDDDPDWPDDEELWL